ncbi:hypothetical protein [Candidatus Cytomitobacter primus]|uniref:Uncharacterized protein n=1 Tax=Candidatus Cytomitobacter primus TaxID=2066024 RepID=A0A5C0UFT9_9PROT|nr:hypothetical protein [Candidatus Cytomitobacter primus]QEK38503.1 hypothetical protein FZC34_01095 [Candidatus Cytomitobacter primus]
MLFYLLIIAASLNAKDSNYTSDEYDYEYRGKAPFNFTGSMEILSNHVYDKQEKESWVLNNNEFKVTDSDVKVKNLTPFNNAKLASAKLGITLQQVRGTAKTGVQFAIKANPGNFEVDQASIYLKNYFKPMKLKLSFRAGYSYGADKKLETLSYGIVRRTSSMYSMADQLFIPGVMTSARIDTNSGKAIKGMFKAKRIINKNSNIIFGVSYTPTVPNKGSQSIQEVSDVFTEMKNHLGFGLKFNNKVGNLQSCTSMTFAHSKRNESKQVKFNNVQGLSIGNNMMYKNFGFGLNYGIVLNRNIKSYDVDFANTIKDAQFNRDTNAANGGYVVSPTVSFTVPSGPLKNVELYASYMHGNRKTEWTQDSKVIHAKSDIFTAGFAVPVRNFVIGTKAEFVKFNNKAFANEELMKRLLKLNIKDIKGLKNIKGVKFNSLKDSNKWKAVLSVFLKVKVFHDFQNDTFKN